MREHGLIDRSQADLNNHPAAASWAKLHLAPLALRRIVILKPDVKRSAVYRLENAGPTSSSLIAKRGRMANVAFEFKIYQEVLSRLPLPNLHCYGIAEDADPKFGWLFLDDAGEERYSSSDEEHRAVAAQWLAVLHATTAEHLETRAWLPSRGLEHYRHIVRLARNTIRPSLSNPVLTAEDRSVLDAILSYCDSLESRWRDVADICNLMPPTLVHGDFSAKNVRTLRGPNGLEILPLDWDSAGWGIAAPDLSRTDPAVYSSVIRHHWPGLTIEATARLAEVGKMLWALEPITGEAEALASDWVGNVMRKMRSYKAEIGDALETAGWAHCPN
jgi:hypothetical protein